MVVVVVEEADVPAKGFMSLRDMLRAVKWVCVYIRIEESI